MSLEDQVSTDPHYCLVMIKHSLEQQDARTRHEDWLGKIRQSVRSKH
ncbi:MAG: hypothetical protein ACXADX_20305 [Candidatus Hodarchaeales archaeon]|jgi:hypothetical protein